MKERLGPVLLGDFFGTAGVDIDHPDQFHAFRFGIFLSMELAKVPDTDHADLDLLHLPTDPPLGLLDKLEEVLDLGQLRDPVLLRPVSPPSPR